MALLKVLPDQIRGMKEKKYLEGRPDPEQLVKEHTGENRFLILHNDEVNSFDFVIETLIKICQMDAIQAEQCTYLVHYKGKCDIKKGEFTYLKPYKDALIDKGLEATID